MSQITKEALKQSFMQLLEEEPLDKITIRSIVDRCQVNRNTFYYHFHDIYELMDDVFTSEAQMLIEENRLVDKWKENIIKVIQYLKQHQKMIYHAYYSLNREQLEKYLYDVVSDLLLKALQAKVAKRNVEAETCETMSKFFTYAFVGMFLEWIRTGMQEEAEHIVSHIDFIMEGSLEYIIDRCA